MYIQKLDDRVNKYNNAYLSRVKMNSFFFKKINYEDPKFKIGDIVRISKYKNTFAMVKFQFKLSKFLWLKKIKNTVPWTYGNGDVKWEEIVEKF